MWYVSSSTYALISLPNKLIKEQLRPHAPLLLLFTTSAQSHIFPEVRLDAVRCLDILLEVIPDVVTNGWADIPDSHGSRVLDGYMSLLNAGSRFNSSSGEVYLHAFIISYSLKLYRPILIFLCCTKRNIVIKCV